MLDFLKKAWDQIVQVSGDIPPARKAAIAGVAAITLGGILLVAYIAKTPDYEVLFAGLSMDDSTAITQRLKENQIPYKLAQDGAAVLIPSRRVLETRLEMATSGLPSGGVVGYEIFDQSTFGMTEFVQKLNYRRALQGELTRTINQFREIQSSRVHIAVPEKRIFTSDKSEPTASIVIKLASGHRLKKNKVQGIVHLVASSVENLLPENVTVVDVDGNVLAGGEPSDEAALLSSNQLEHRSNMEKSMERRITSMLENIVGPGKVVTRVTADIDFKRTERTEKKFDPASQVARSEQRSESKSVGEQAPIGVPGVQSNIPGAERPAAATSKPATTNNSAETTNYEINEVTAHVIEQVGVIKRLSIAVVVDGKYKEKEGGDKEYSPRSPEEIKQLSGLVETASGYNEKRGDKIVVESAPFDISRFAGEIDTANAQADRQLYADIVKYAGLGILAVILFLFVARPIIKSITAASSDIETLRQFPQTIEQMEAKYATAEESVDFRTKSRQLIDKDPKAAAEMVREWLRTKR
ncbi:Flagellar M-ring protein FliF [hydrothermal vent metagenome]|uniref:Flagellar M-ring protein FliF n=1 Tax=hydrothermal vent metagenome TaxID=652676 RepID=A0A3B1C1U6_9ZZZZ